MCVVGARAACASIVRRRGAARGVVRRVPYALHPACSCLLYLHIAAAIF